MISIIQILFENQNKSKVKNLVNNILEKYKNKIPIYTTKIRVKSGVIPHSHPVLTLNTKHIDSQNPEVVYLSLLVHEQLHWFAVKNQTKEDFDYLYKKYNDFYKKQKIFKNKISFLEHIIVIWNEINIMKKILSKKDFDWLYSQYDKLIYKEFNKWVINNFNKIQKDLKKLNLIWRKMK